MATLSTDRGGSLGASKTDRPRLDLRVRVRRASGARPDRAALRAACTAALEHEGISGDVILTVTFVDDEGIRTINAEHRGMDRPTDVLSFSLVDDPDPSFVLPAGEPRELGDIVISYPRAVAQAGEYAHSVEREVAYLTVHGLLHILGYDHETDYERAVMRDREEAALLTVGLTR